MRDATGLVDPALVQPRCPACGAAADRVAVNGVEFDAIDADGLGDAIRRFLACGRPHVVHFLAAHPTVLARSDRWYRALLAAGDLIVADGAPVAMLVRLARRHARRITSTDAFWQLATGGVAEGTRHFFVGGANEDVERRIRRELSERLSSFEVAGFEVPPFRPYTDDEVDRLAARIRSARADIVWVGIGAPKQDVLAHRLRRAGAAPVIACVGATFDFVAGTKRRAPRMLRALGLEWAFRLWLEPRRLWRRYLVGNCQFLAGVVMDATLKGLRTR